MTTKEPRPGRRVCAGRTGFPSGGAEGIRTPDLLIANASSGHTRGALVLRLTRLTVVSVAPLRHGGTRGARALA